MREAWTDERLDDLNERVSEGFREVNRRIDSLERSNGELRDQIGLVREQIGSVDGKLEVLIRTLQVGSAFLAAILVAIMGMIATQL